MKKKSFLALLLALLVLGSCCFGAVAEDAADTKTIGGADAETEIVVTDEAAEEDAVAATAYNGEITVYLSEVKDLYEEMLASYISYYSQYGYEIDEYDIEFQDAVAQETVQYELSQRIVEAHAAKNGYELNDEKKAELSAEAETTLDSIREYYESYLSYYGYEGEELAKIVEDELAAGGYTLEKVYETLALQDLLNYVFELATADVTVTEEDAKAAFDAKVAQAQTSYEDVDTFINAYLEGEEIIYTPENVRLMHCIYIALEETSQEETPDEAAAEEAADIAALTGLAKANAVLEAIRAGMNFDEAMTAYNEDGSTAEQMELGYPVAEGGALYGDEFQAGAMALQNIGDVSDVIVTDYGYFILEYAKDLEAGAVDFESRKETETAEALTTKKDEVYSEYINVMLDEAGIEMGDLSGLYHVYNGESVDATIAYASVTEACTLTDMPAGDAVASLAAGASLDVLGKIGVDGEEYAFVAVPNTEYKGYVNVKVMADMEPDAALAVDNAALATAAEAVDKLPTFTIVMNDGSLIYGELYPDVAPESVGNFVELANASFYDGLIFHRVIPGFMIQGGDPNGDGTGGPGYAIRGEFTENGVENALSHTRGVLSMARSSALDSAGSQFFIMHADSDYLDGQYAAFGMVLGGMETVDLIASTPTNSSDKPMSDQTMRTVYVETYGKTYAFTKLED